MSILLKSGDVRAQSKSVWKQFRELWISNATENKKLIKGTMHEFEHMGIGKSCVFVAMGASLEKNVETLKKYRDRVDIVCCDKAFSPLLEHGVKADYVVVADAGIPYRFIEKHIQDTKDVTLFATPYSNPVWTKMWKGPVYFYVNQDAIGTEEVFRKIMGSEQRVIPASSNVSNAMIVLMTDCNEHRNANWSGYEKFFLLGYDYSWMGDGNYYAWENPKPKRYYLNHRTMPSHLKNKVIHSSENLIFSAKWLVSYVTTFKLPIYNCSDQGILDLGSVCDLETELKKINPSKNIQEFVRKAFDAWKDSFNATKRCEVNFKYGREVLLWQ